MSTAEIEVFEAFTSIGISSEKAMAAAAALNRRDATLEVDTLRADMSGLKTDMLGMKSDMSVVKVDISGLKLDMVAVKSDISLMKVDISGLKIEVAVLRWMCGVIIVLVIAVLLRLLVR